MYAACNHLYWKSPVSPMKGQDCLLTFKPGPEIIKYDSPQSFISSFVLRSNSSFWKSSLEPGGGGGYYGRASSFAPPQEYVNNTLIWGCTVLITAPHWPPTRSLPQVLSGASSAPWSQLDVEGPRCCLFTCLMAFNALFKTTRLVWEEGSADRDVQGGLTGGMHINRIHNCIVITYYFKRYFYLPIQKPVLLCSMYVNVRLY